MSISVHQLLDKMEDQLKEAKNSSSESRIRERVYAIKSLCELLLEQEENGTSTNRTVAFNPSPMLPQGQGLNPPIQQVQTQKLKLDEGNGDSLFDF